MADTPTTAHPDVAALLAGAQLPEKTVDICLRPDLVAALEDVDRQFTALDEPGVDARLTSGAERRRLAEAAQALREQMRASTVVFRLRALPRKKWDALVKAHPPRPDEDDDKRIGYNADTFYDSLIRACTVEPALDEGQWSALLDALSSAQWQALAGTAQGLNLRKVDVPFSRAASHLTTLSDNA